MGRPKSEIFKLFLIFLFFVISLQNKINTIKIPNLTIIMTRIRCTWALKCLNFGLNTRSIESASSLFCEVQVAYV